MIATNLKCKDNICWNVPVGAACMYIYYLHIRLYILQINTTDWHIHHKMYICRTHGENTHLFGFFLLNHVYLAYVSNIHLMLVMFVMVVMFVGNRSVVYHRQLQMQHSWISQHSMSTILTIITCLTRPTAIQIINLLSNMTITTATATHNKHFSKTLAKVSKTLD